jgi:hypothetical protein
MVLRGCGIAAVAIGVMVGMVACLPVPLGDPAKAVADARYVGAWHWKEEGGRTNLATIRPWDDRTFVVDIMMFEGELASATPKGRLVCKGWLAEVKGKTFLNLQQIEFLAALPGEKRERYFMIAKLELSGDQLTATGLDGGYEPFKGIATTTDLEKLVGEKMDDAKMWAKPIVAKKLGRDQMEALEKLAKKYEE